VGPADSIEGFNEKDSLEVSPRDNGGRAIDVGAFRKANGLSLMCIVVLKRLRKKLKKRSHARHLSDGHDF